jgi:hypothetical protein
MTAEAEASENVIGIFMLTEPHAEKEIEPQLNQLLKTQYEIDKLGIVDSPEKKADEEEAKRILHENIRINNEGRIEVPLLWKKGNLKVPKNKA